MRIRIRDGIDRMTTTVDFSRQRVGSRTTIEVVVPSDWSQALVREYVLDKLWRGGRIKPVDLVLTECGQGTYEWQLTWLASY